MAQTAEFQETWVMISGFPTVDPSIASYMLILSAFARNSEHALIPSYCGYFPMSGLHFCSEVQSHSVYLTRTTPFGTHCKDIRQS